MRRRKKTFTGNDRALMFLKSDMRRRWMQYGENRAAALKASLVKNTRHGEKLRNCAKCDEVLRKDQCQVDHIKPVGERFYTPEDMVSYWKKMHKNPCEVLCYTCHSKKTKIERDRRKK